MLIHANNANKLFASLALTRISASGFMALEIKKENGETSQALVRRFSKRLKMSGVLLRARRTRFHSRKKSEPMKKRSALRREELKTEYENLKKLGKIEEKTRY